MKKKELSALNEKLFDERNEARENYKNALSELETLKIKNQELSAELERIKSEQTASEALKKLEKSVKLSLGDDKQYAAETIGKIVLDAAKKCNSLTRDGNKNNLELVNLILGRTEVAKAEILRACKKETPLDEKKLIIDNEKTDAMDYFISILAQND